MKLPSNRERAKTIREAAIEALLCCADAMLSMTPEDWLFTWDVLPAGSRAELLAHWAHEAAVGVDSDRRYLEAAGLLLDGWNPGDEVELR